MDSLTLALLNMPIETGDKAANLASLISHFTLAAENGADIVLAPELALTGYAVREFESLAEQRDGPAISVLSGVCRKLNIAAGFGLVLSSGDAIYNAYAIVNGDECRIYGKQHRWWHGDHPFAVWPASSVFNVRGINVGVMVCFDGRFPESARMLALAGADLIAWPCCWPGAPKSDPRYLDIIGRARSFENQCYVALANRCGFSKAEDTQYAGQSALYGPLGQQAAASGQAEEILYANLNMAHLHDVRKRFDIYSERRPEQYSAVATKKAPNWFEETR